jgi:hypothetical protein
MDSVVPVFCAVAGLSMTHPAFILAVVLIAFAGLVCGVSLLYGWLSGWRALARRFPARPGMEGERIPIGFRMMVGAVSYGSHVVVETTPEALLLTNFPLFIGHPPLALPWSVLELQPGWGMLFWGGGRVRVNDQCTLRFAQGPFDLICAAHRRYTWHGTSCAREPAGRGC